MCSKWSTCRQLCSAPPNLRAALRGRARPAPLRCGLCPRGSAASSRENAKPSGCGKGRKEGIKNPNEAKSVSRWEASSLCAGEDRRVPRGPSGARALRERCAGRGNGERIVCAPSLTQRRPDSQESSGQRVWFLGNARNSNVKGKKRIRKSLGKRLVYVTQSVAVPRQLESAFTGCLNYCSRFALFLFSDVSLY